mmetsp:Transcript_13271/g.42332  ORF Transcript_13271/g.42332 Transcript_13271/m.42332 type:complete len:200 (-) Transcript_13271:2155-2754(-)
MAGRRSTAIPRAHALDTPIPQHCHGVGLSAQGLAHVQYPTAHSVPRHGAVHDVLRGARVPIVPLRGGRVLRHFSSQHDALAYNVVRRLQVVPACPHRSLPVVVEHTLRHAPAGRHLRDHVQLSPLRRGPAAVLHGGRVFRYQRRWYDAAVRVVDDVAPSHHGGRASQRVLAPLRHRQHLRCLAARQRHVFARDQRPPLL